MKAVVYSRVSTDAQERDGTSLDTQERACVAYAEEHGWTVTRCLRDTVSGATLDRPGMNELRAALRRGEVGAVVAYAVDRIAREQVKMAVFVDDVYESGAQLAIVTEPFDTTPTGQLILSVRSFAAQVEREKIAERTQRGKGERARSGRIPQATGRGIYGYRYDPTTGKRSVVDEQAAIVRRVFGEFVGQRSCNGIADRLNADGVPAFAGGRWYALTVRRVLLNETYTGRTTYRRTRVTKVRGADGRWVRRVVERDEAEWVDVPGATPAIVSREDFERAQRILTDPERRKRIAQPGTYALHGRVRCERCGAAMTGHVVGRSTNGHRYYRCTKGSSGPGETTCDSKYVRADALEHLVREELAALLADPERVLAEVKRANSQTSGASKAASLRKQLDEVAAQKLRLVDLNLAGTFDKATLDAKGTAFDARAAALTRLWREASAEPSAIDVGRLTAELPNALAAIRAWVCGATGDQLELLLRAVDVEVRASTDRVVVSGSVPLEAPGKCSDGPSVEASARFALLPRALRASPQVTETKNKNRAEKEEHRGAVA